MDRRRFLAIAGATVLSGCGTGEQNATVESSPTVEPTATPIRSTPTGSPTPTDTEEPSPTPSAVPQVRYQVMYPHPWEGYVESKRTDGNYESTLARSRSTVSRLGHKDLIQWVRIRIVKRTTTDSELLLVLDANGDVIATDRAPPGDDAAVIYHSFDGSTVPTFTPTVSPTAEPAEFVLESASYSDRVEVDEPFTLSFRIGNTGGRAAELQTTLQYDYGGEVGDDWKDVQSFSATIDAGNTRPFETDYITVDTEGDYHFRLTNVDMNPFTITAVN